MPKSRGHVRVEVDGEKVDRQPGISYDDDFEKAYAARVEKREQEALARATKKKMSEADQYRRLTAEYQKLDAMDEKGGMDLDADNDPLGIDVAA